MGSCGIYLIAFLAAPSIFLIQARRRADRQISGELVHHPPVLFTGALTALHACLYVLPAAAGLLVVLGLPGPGGHETVCHCEPACPPGHVSTSRRLCPLLPSLLASASSGAGGPL